VTGAGQLAVIERDWHLDVADIAWEHVFLTRLAGTGFPAPRPIAAFEGRSWTIVNGGLWPLASFQPGRTLARADQPDLAAVGRSSLAITTQSSRSRRLCPGRWSRTSTASRVALQACR
jgi:Ser/Thr protein kinase RdoA (MazF antagonist)